jgi:uncharacterized UBP type Zn finger protein
MPTCVHIATVNPKIEPRTPGACEDCLATGGRWVHLRLCLSCGKVGCCDSSPNKHASAHFAADNHPVMASAEPGEDWRWCFVDQTLV